MENERREPFKKYKELRISLGMSTHEATLVPYTHDRTSEKICDTVSNVLITSNMGIVLTIKETGKYVHVKYNTSVVTHEMYVSELIFKDVELYTPFVYDPTHDDDKYKNHKWISWDEWESNERYKTIIDIVVPWDDRLSEHGTDLEFILSKICLACESVSNKANFKQNIGYRDDAFYIDMAYGDCYCRDKNEDRYHINHRYYASENTINVDIRHLGGYNDIHEISFKFDDKHSLTEIKVKHATVDGMLRFMDIDNTALREYINRIRNYINKKCAVHKLTSHIDIEVGGNVQTWNISNRCDDNTKKKQKPTPEDRRNAMERGKMYDIEHTYFSTVVKYIFDEFGLTIDPSQIKGVYHGDASNNNESIFISVNTEACTVSLSVFDKSDNNKRIVVKMEFDNADGFIHTVNVESYFKNYYELRESISPKTLNTLQGLRSLVKSATSPNDFSFGVLDDYPWGLNLNEGSYGQTYSYVSKEDDDSNDVEPTMQSELIDYIEKHFSHGDEICKLGRFTVAFDSKSYSQKICFSLNDCADKVDRMIVTIKDIDLMSIDITFDYIGNISDIKIADPYDVYSQIQFTEITDFLKEIENIYGKKIFGKFKLYKNKEFYAQIAKELIGIYNDSKFLGRTHGKSSREEEYLIQFDSTDETLEFTFKQPVESTNQCVTNMDDKYIIQLTVSDSSRPKLMFTVNFDRYKCYLSKSILNSDDYQIKNERLNNLINELSTKLG